MPSPTLWLLSFARRSQLGCSVCSYWWPNVRRSDLAITLFALPNLESRFNTQRKTFRSYGIGLFLPISQVGEQYRFTPMETNAMQEQSVFIAGCLCGRLFKTPLRDYVCPACNRHVVLEWGRDPGR